MSQAFDAVAQQQLLERRVSEALELARSLGVAPRIMIRGQLITAEAQPVVDAAFRGAWDEVKSLAAERDPTTLDEAFRVLVVDDRFDLAKALLEQAPREGMRGDYLIGLLSQMTGDISAARTAYEAATSVENAASGAHCQLAWLMAEEGNWEGALEHARAKSDKIIKLERMNLLQRTTDASRG